MLFKSKPKFTHNRTFKLLASIHFAILSLFLFTFAMILGTLIESHYGPRYANLTVYHAWWFYILEGSIITSLIFAVLDRIPFQKRLIGFYIIHTSIVIIMFGVLITRIYGLDGHIVLHPGQPAKHFNINENLIYIEANAKKLTFHLPKTAFMKTLSHHSLLSDGSYLSIIQYIPYAKPVKQEGGNITYEKNRQITNEEKTIEAVLVNIQRKGKTKQFWISNQNMIKFKSNTLSLSGFIGPRIIPLPFSMTLDHFKIDTVEGTQDPSSFNSFIKIDPGNHQAHVSMNHPYKRNGYFFYQASYFQDHNQAYHSVLSVNKDPGRYIKYFGSLLFIIGLIIQLMHSSNSVKYRHNKTIPKRS